MSDTPKSKDWDEMTDQEKSDDINRSIEHHAKHGPDVQGPLPDSAAATVQIISATLAQALKSDLPAGPNGALCDRD